MEKVATLQEIETYWSMEDVMDANAFIDAKYKLLSLSVKNKGG